LLDFLPGHPFATSHALHYTPRRSTRVPNFIGPTLPRSDQGDRDYYCSTMLSLFRAWCAGLDLKHQTKMWEDAFDLHSFSKRDGEVMKNFNIRYECLDAQDDFHTQMKKGS
ncbi:hypothetical protein L208DRAFT_1204405, partial [Tricholoma matsutake]